MGALGGRRSRVEELAVYALIAAQAQPDGTNARLLLEDVEQQTGLTVPRIQEIVEVLLDRGLLIWGDPTVLPTGTRDHAVNYDLIIDGDRLCDMRVARGGQP